MTKRMLVDATHPEETRVAIVDGNWLSDFDFERTSKKQLKGNIYLAKVIRIEPSLQAAFVEYGGNRHGFLPFSEIHPDYFRIPMADRPPDEEPPEDDADGYEPGEKHVDTSAYEAEEQELTDESAAEHDHDAMPEMMPEAPSLDLAETTPEILQHMEPAPLAQPASEFGADAPQDLGLITDFGNAALEPAIIPAEAAPLETVGGEVAEEERVRRAPRMRYKIQEVVKRRQVMLIQVVKEERGNKGAALTSFLSLAGRYCVLMPNTDHGGGVSRKITSHQDRRRMKEILDQLEIPEGMAVILRTAGMEQEPAEIQRDLEYLLRLWNNIREETLQSTAPALIYEEANLIKRSMRDMYGNDLSEILVAGQRGHQLAVDFMRTIMPDQLDKVKLYEDTVPLFFRYNVEKQIDQLYNTTVQLRSGGYIVINPTEALVSIDVNSGRATRERNIEGTALKTNLEAAEEIARQLRLRDLAGLVVIDFIDMEDGRNNAAVERRVKDAMRVDRARLQIGRISPFGLLELSRQRLHSSLMEINFEKCPHCAGVGLIRSVDSAAISILRMIEEEGIRQGAAELVLHLPTKVALYILNQKRGALSEIERRYNLQVLLHSEDALVPPDYKLERVRPGGQREVVAPVTADKVFENMPSPPPSENFSSSASEGGEGENRNNNDGGRRRGRFGRGGRDRGGDRNGGDRGDRNRNNPSYNQQSQQSYAPPAQISAEASGNETEMLPSEGNDGIGNIDGAHLRTTTAPGQPQPHGGRPDDQQQRSRRRGRRGGRGRRSGQGGPNGENRPPRDPHYQPREGQQNFQGEHPPRNDQQRGNWNQNRAYNQGNNVPPPPPVNIPVSIHDIDTTPREHAAPSYEVVDQSPDKPKGGWWRKLTGQ